MMRPIVWAFSIHGFLAAAAECQGPGEKCDSMSQEVETAGFVMLAHRQEISRITEAEEETSTTAKVYPESPSTYCGSGSNGCGSEGNCAGANQLHLRGKTVKECQAECDKRQLCGGFRYQKSVGHCHFYKNCVETKTGNADLSYYKAVEAPVLACPQSHPFKYPGTQRCFVKKWEDGCSLNDQFADLGHPLCTDVLMCPQSHPFKYPGTQRCFMKKWAHGCSLNEQFEDALHPSCMVCPRSHAFKYPGTQRCFVKKWEDGCSLNTQFSDPGHPLCTEVQMCPQSHPFKYPGTQRCFVKKWENGCSLNDHFADASHPLCTQA